MKPKKNIVITKASGELVPYLEEKLRNSLMKSGANDKQVKEILKSISAKLYPGISTKKIYRMAFNSLRNSSSSLAAKYHLKRAIMELGPSGYPFEKFVGELLKHQGYDVILGEIVKGQCVSHEIDVIALTNNRHFMIECKYHNQQGIISDVKIPLYIQSRFKDVEASWIKMPGHEKRIHQGWVVTNTKFTEDAITYATCVGLRLLSWDYPIKGSLKDMIDNLGLYPVTCLTSLTRAEKQKLLDKKIVLCRQVCDGEDVLHEIGMSANRIKKVMEEGKELAMNLMSKNEVNV